MNAIFFYHYMEFMSSTPPENLVPYFSVEGPYILSMALIVYKVYIAGSNPALEGQEGKARTHSSNKSDYISVRRSDEKRYDASLSAKNENHS